MTLFAHTMVWWPLLKVSIAVALLLDSMYFLAWLIQLNRSYKYNGKIARPEISTVALHEKLKKINCNHFSILGVDRWFRNFPQCIFCTYSAIFGHFLGVRGGSL